jgi:polyisoprenoid-binding protein YceI
MKYLLAILIVSSLQFSSQKTKAAINEPDTLTYQLDTSASKVEWACDIHQGYISFDSGELKVVNGEIVKGNFDVCMESIVDIDIDYDLMRLTLQNTLKSIDFFYAEKYHYSSFTIDRVEYKQNTATLYGDLTIIGITDCIRFQFSQQLEADTIRAESEEITLDRTNWGITSMSKEDAKSDKSFIVPNDFRIVVTLVGIKNHQ